MNIVSLIAGIGDLARAILRTPLVELRILVETPAAWAPAMAAVFITSVAWWRDQSGHARGRLNQASDIFAGVFGLLILVWLFHAGRCPWTEGDWREQWTFFIAWKQALHDGTLPYYLQTAMQGTERYLANPQTPLMPYVLALAFVGLRTFFLFHMLLVFGIGLLGAFSLRRELALRTLPWTMSLLIFTLNGHIVAHLAVGHLPWAAYFLTPWLLVSAVRIARGDRSSATAATCAATFGGMILIGGWHVFVWSLLFIVITCLGQPRCLWLVARIGLLTASLAAVRLAPAVVTYGEGTNVFVSGYPSGASLLAALVATPIPDERLDAWELDAFVGYVGFALLCIGAVPFRESAKRSLNVLLLPSAALIILSIGDIYAWTLFRLPGFVSERVTTRFIILPILWLTCAACVRIDSWWRRANQPLAGSVVWLGSSFLAVELVLRAQTWRPHAGTALDGLPTNVLKDSPVEPLYFWSFWCGAAVSAASALAVAHVLKRRRPAATEIRLQGDR